MRFRPALLIGALVMPAPAAASTDCAGLAAERAGLEAEHKQRAAAIADIAMGKKPKPAKRRGSGAAQVGQLAAGTAASLLLPFPFGTALSLGSAAARAAARKSSNRQAPPAPAPAPDVEAMVRRQNEIETRLAEIAAAGCPAAATQPTTTQPSSDGAGADATPPAEAPKPAD